MSLQEHLAHYRGENEISYVAFYIRATCFQKKQRKKQNNPEFLSFSQGRQRLRKKEKKKNLVISASFEVAVDHILLSVFLYVPVCCVDIHSGSSLGYSLD